jgi:tRNA U34 5-methylaminomethyl-2-thiouridine-forming methyltransferase MnmC
MQVIPTKDGSHTIYLPDLKESFHSMNGAIDESRHVYINAGLNASSLKSLRVFEMGFGTGLNALLTWIQNKMQNRKINYHAVDNNPLKTEIFRKLNYEEILGLTEEEKLVFLHMHNTRWDKNIRLDDNFSLYKFQMSLHDFDFTEKYDLIYFDAFSPEKQPDIWTYQIFEKVFAAMNTGAILTSYCAKGKVKRMIKDIGFKIEMLPGPAGKREMIRAIK